MDGALLGKHNNCVMGILATIINLCEPLLIAIMGRFLKDFENGFFKVAQDKKGEKHDAFQ